jgi:hypothetical protein
MEYFILKPDGEATGTYSLEQIRDMLKTGFIGLDTCYWHEGIPDWQPIERIEGSVHVPEPHPDQPKALPPPHKWSGSLARAIPSPYQVRKPSGPIVPGTDPAPSRTTATTLAVPAVPVPHRPATAVPTSAPRTDSSVHARAAATNGHAAAETRGENAVSPRRRSWLPRPSAARVCAVALILLTAAIVTALVESRHPAKSPLSRVTVSLHNNCVLTSQTAIKPLEADMADAPVVARLRDIIAKSTSAAFKQSAEVGLRDEIEKHEREVTQKYLDDGRAQFVAPGLYDAVAYLDDNGELVPAHRGDPWAAFTYRGAVVYTYLGSDFRLMAPEPVTATSP